jgi:hypothetical protein
MRLVPADGTADGSSALGENVSGAGGSKVDDAVVIFGLEWIHEAAP